MSAEFIQKHEAADEDSERNPEVDVGGDGMKQIAGTVGLAGRHWSLGMEVAESGVPS
jgi:hypothetical protein